METTNANSNDVTATAAEEGRSSSPDRSAKRMRLSPGPSVSSGDEQKKSPSRNKRLPFKSYDCPACKAKNLSGRKLRDHFREKHNDNVEDVAADLISKNNKNKTAKSLGQWSDAECRKFEAGCICFGWGKWFEIANWLQTRDRNQVKSHAQKFQLHRPEEYETLIAYHRGGQPPASDDDVSEKKPSAAANEADARVIWTQEEQEQFKMGVIINGWGQWIDVAKNVPTKNHTQVRSRGLNVSRYRKEEEASMKAEHAKLVARNPHLFSNEYVEQMKLRYPEEKGQSSPSKEPTEATADASAAAADEESNASEQRQQQEVEVNIDKVETDVPADKPSVAKSVDSTQSTQSSVRSSGYETGTWSYTERQQFQKAVVQFGWGDWVSVTEQIPTRNKKQVKSHAQKFELHRPEEKAQLDKEHLKVKRKQKKMMKTGIASPNKKKRQKADVEEEGKMTDVTSPNKKRQKTDVEEERKMTDDSNDKEEKMTDDSNEKEVEVEIVDDDEKVEKETANSDEMEVETVDIDEMEVKEIHEENEQEEHGDDEEGEKSEGDDQKENEQAEEGDASSSSGDSNSNVEQEEASSENNSCDVIISMKDPNYKSTMFSFFQKLGAKSKGERDYDEEMKVKVEAFSFFKNSGGRLMTYINYRRPEDGLVELEDEIAREKIFRDFAARLESAQHWSKDNSDDEMEVKKINGKNEQKDHGDNEGGKAEDEEKDDESSASGSSGESPQQNLRVSPRVVKAPRDNYIDSLGKEQWQRKKKEGPVGSGGVRKRGDSAYEVRVWYNARKWQIGTFETEELAQLAHQIAKDILKPENTPADSAAVEWNVKIARDAAIDGVKLAARDTEEGREGGVGLLEPPKATQNYLLGGHIVSAGEQTIKHRLFSTATATRTSTILAHFTVTCSNGPIHVDVTIDDSLFDLRRKIFDQFDAFQLDDGNCNFNFQVDTNMISRKVERSYIARDLIQLGKSVELIPRSAVLAGESSQDAAVEETMGDDDEEEDLTALSSFYEAAGSTIQSKLIKLADEVANVSPSSTADDVQPKEITNFLRFMKETSSTGETKISELPGLEYVYMMEQTGLYNKEVQNWVHLAKNGVTNTAEKPESKILTVN